MLADLVSGEGLLPSLWTATFLLYLHIVEEDRDKDQISCNFTYKGTSPVIMAPPSWPNYLPKSSPPIINPWGFRMSISEIYWDISIQCIASSSTLVPSACWYLSLGLTSHDHKMTAIAPGITSSFFNAINRNRGKGEKEPSLHMAFSSIRGEIFTLKHPVTHHILQKLLFILLWLRTGPHAHSRAVSGKGQRLPW